MLLISIKGSHWWPESSTDVNQLHTILLGWDKKVVIKSKNIFFPLYKLHCLISSEFLAVCDNSQRVLEMTGKQTPQSKLFLEDIQSLSPILECARKQLLSGVLAKRSYGEEKNGVDFVCLF